MDEQDMFSARTVLEGMGLTSDTNPPTSKTGEPPKKPTAESVIAIRKRLSEMSLKRRAKVTSDLLESFASSLSRFPLTIVDKVCTEIEESERKHGEASFPMLGTLIEMCRREASHIAPKEGHTRWSLVEYRECVWFDRFLKEQTEIDKDHPDRKPKTRSEVFQAYPGMARLWIKWQEQKLFGFAFCPEWCDECEGEKSVIRYTDGKQFIKPWSRGPYGMGHDANNKAETELRRTMASVSIPCPKCRPQQVVERKPPSGYPAHSSGAKVVYR